MTAQPAHSDLDWFDACGMYDEPAGDNQLRREFESIGGDCTTCAVRDANCCVLAECPFLPICPQFAAISVTARRELLRQAVHLIERAARYERWGPLAQEDALNAGEMLRRAGLADLAAECGDEFGIDAASLLREIDAEARR